LVALEIYLIRENEMKKEWFWGPGRIDPEYKGLTKREYLERLAKIREMYL
jgi:hypothetical protein